MHGKRQCGRSAMLAQLPHDIGELLVGCAAAAKLLGDAGGEELVLAELAIVLRDKLAGLVIVRRARAEADVVVVSIFVNPTQFNDPNDFEKYPRDDAADDAALEREVSGPQENGWLVADMMVRLGLLGTVVGFIVMLASMNGAQDFDLATLRNMMTEMSAGMRIALFTTLAGITSGLLLGIQYRIAERGADALLSAIAVATESKLLPAIARGASE